jgi:hypothetical protein
MQALKLMKDRDRKQEGGGEGKQRDIIFKLVIPQQTTIGKPDVAFLSTSLTSINHIFL